MCGLPANLSPFFSAKRLACACESRCVTSSARAEVCAPGDLGRSRAIRLYCTGHATPPSCLVCPPEHFRNHLKLTMAIKLGTCNAVAIIKYQYMLWEVLAWTSLEVFRALTRDENLSTACLPNWSMTPFSCIMISDLLPNCSFSWDPCRCHEFLPYHPSSTDTIEGSHLRRKKAEYEEVQIEAHAGEAHAVKKNVLQRTLNVRTIDQYQDYVDGLIRSMRVHIMGHSIVCYLMDTIA